MSAVQEAERYGVQIFEDEGRGWQWLALDPKGDGVVANPFRTNEDGGVERFWFGTEEEAAQDCLRVIAKMQVEAENEV